MDKMSCVSRYLDIKIHILSMLIGSFCESRTSAPIGKTRTESSEISPSSFSSRAPEPVRLLPKSNCLTHPHVSTKTISLEIIRKHRDFSLEFFQSASNEISRFPCPNNTCNFTFRTFRILLGRRSTKSRKRKNKREVATRSNV